MTRGAGVPARAVATAAVAAPEGPSRSAREAARTGLYLHVPFCAVRCRYCDFSSGALSAAAVGRYLTGMEREVERRAPAARGTRFTSVFYGGGTPSALSPRHFLRLDALLRAHFDLAPDAEVTLEANPESVKPGLLDAWAAGGVNRLSMGVQSFHADELTLLGRIHDARRPVEAMRLARAHGFRRLSLDLMYGFPGHTLERFLGTLSRAVDLTPEHLSAYCFIPEPGTPLGDASLRDPSSLPAVERQAAMYERMTERLGTVGYGPYETSNFCRPGAEARHNLVYWLRRDYLGLGPSAHGLWRGVRHGNPYAMEAWARALETGADCGQADAETAQSRADEIVMLGLRFATGIDEADHAAEAWRGVMERFGGAFADGIAVGRLQRTAEGFRVAPHHRFVADDVIAWLMARADRDERVRRRERERPRRGGFDRRASASVPSGACHKQPSPAA